MSKYLMNKLIHLVNMDAAAEKEYAAKPREFVERWEKTQTLKLEPEEREALATKDYGKLYALGAHPFTLWSFTEEQAPLSDALFATGVVASGDRKITLPPGFVPLFTPVTRMVEGAQVKLLVFEPPQSR